MLLQQDASAPLAQILNEENLREMQREVATIHTSDAIIHYILRLVSESRESNDYPNPLSPRASRAILQGAKAWGWLCLARPLTPLG